jgi:hypothetical protein
MKDNCILCGKETVYDESTHVDMRTGYIEGAGQLCSECWSKGNSREHIIVPVSVIKHTPNDQELGSKVRDLYHEIY